MQQDKPEKQSKQYDSFKRNLHYHIKEYQRVREWADINNWLIKLQQYLLTNSKFQQLPHSVTLAKRLAQCLNPNIPPGVHSEALKAYALILSRFQDRERLLPLMSIGLFPFFQYSSSQLKLELLRIFEQFFLCDSGSVQMVISLMNSLLTALNDNNEQLQKKVFHLCDKMSRKYGYLWIDGAVWVNILKSNKVRIAGYKYFMKVFKDRDRQRNMKQQRDRDRTAQESKEGKEEADDEEQNTDLSLEKSSKKQEKKSNSFRKRSSSNNLKVLRNCLRQEQLKFIQAIYAENQIPDGTRNRFPNFSVLVVNALSVCLQPQSDSLVKRAALDMIVNYLKLSDNEIMNKEDGVILVQSMLRILTKKEFSLSRRIYTYLFDQPNMDGTYKIDSVEQKYEISILLHVIQKMLRGEHGNGNYRNKSHSKNIESRGGSAENRNRYNMLNIKSTQSVLSILQTLLTDHKDLLPIMLPEISYDVLIFLKMNCFRAGRMIPDLKKRILEFNENIIMPNRMIFIQAILKRVQRGDDVVDLQLESSQKKELLEEKEASNKGMEIMVEKQQKGRQNEQQKIQIDASIPEIDKVISATDEDINSVLKAEKKKVASSQQFEQQELLQVVSVLDFYIYTLHKTKQVANYNSKGSAASNANTSIVNKKSSSASNEQDAIDAVDADLTQQQLSEQLKLIGVKVINRILTYLKATQMYQQKLSIQALDLANKILQQTLINYNGFSFPQELTNDIDQLISLDPQQAIYARLITLHPYPRKQILLPHIRQGSFAIVCISNLLPTHRVIQLTPHQQTDLFYAIFKLLQCHLWQTQAYQFIKEFHSKYPDTFMDNISKVDTSEWLIYWRISDGDVKGGVIRMIKDAKSENPLRRHMSCKWIEDSQMVVSKIIDPIYQELRRGRQNRMNKEKNDENNDKGMDNNFIEGKDVKKDKTCSQSAPLHQPTILSEFEVYQQIKVIFQKSKDSFARYFFIQKEKYVIPLLDVIFSNLEEEQQSMAERGSRKHLQSANTRSKFQSTKTTESMDMLKFLLLQAEQEEQRRQFTQLTLPKVLGILRHLLSMKNQANDKSSRDIDHIYEADVIESRQFHMNRLSSLERTDSASSSAQSLAYLQEIQIIQYFIAINASMKKSIKARTFKGEQAFIIFDKTGLYTNVIRGLFESQLPYIRTLYLDYLRDSCQLLSKTGQSGHKILEVLINLILEKLFLILKTQDISEIENKIQMKKQHNLKNSMISRTRKHSGSFGPVISTGEEGLQGISAIEGYLVIGNQQDQKPQKKISPPPSMISNKKESFVSNKEGNHSSSFYHQDTTISKNDLNVESRYSQIIQIWNSVKFYIKFSIDNSIPNLPIVNLLSLVLQSFPFSYLKYIQMIMNEDSLNREAMEIYQMLQEQIKSVTGLKKQVLQIIDTIWANFNLQICNFLIERGDPRILIHCSMNPVKVLTTLRNSQKLSQISKYYKSVKLNLPKNIWHYNGQILAKQNQINYFLYLYLMYCNFSLIKSKKVGGYLDQLLAIIKILRHSQHIQTKLWGLEILHLLSERVLLNKQIYIEGGQRIREDLQHITKEIINDLVECVIKEKGYTHRTEIKTGFINNLFSKEQKECSLYDFIKLYPPTINTIFEAYDRKYGRNKFHNNRMLNATNNSSKKQPQISSPTKSIQIVNQDSCVESLLFSQWLNLSQTQFQSYLSICSIKTLIAISNTMIINIFDKDLVKVTNIIRQIVSVLLPVCEDKRQSNQISIELISQYIHNILSNKSLKEQLLPMIRKNLLSVYMGNDFFKCTRKSLYYWKQIVDDCTAGNDLLSELLAKQGLFEGFLKGKTQVLRQKIKSFERICFVIYSGKVDKYENKLRTVLQSLNQVMKQQNPPPALLILMLFCIRILLMRLSHNTLSKMFRSIWPGLITILIQIFTAKNKISKNINLILAALKVVELIHALEIEEFNFHKWMFILDFFGIRIEPTVSEDFGDKTQEELHASQQQQSNQSQIQSSSSKSQQILTPFIFKPYMTGLLPQHSFKCEFKPVYDDFFRLHPQSQSKLAQTRKIVIKQPNIEAMEEVQNLAYILMQYMIECNQKNVKVNRKEIEELIEADFISLDDYIFELK